MIMVGSEVGWPWAGSLATGKVMEMHHSRHEITTKGKLIVRNGTTDDPALVILHSKGSYVLKLQHEVKQLNIEP